MIWNTIIASYMCVSQHDSVGVWLASSERNSKNEILQREQKLPTINTAITDCAT